MKIYYLFALLLSLQILKKGNFKIHFIPDIKIKQALTILTQ
jgi:hypothetical protein